MNHFILRFAPILPLVAVAACAAPTADVDPSSTSEAALTNARLEKSHIEVVGTNTAQHDVGGLCAIDATKFRVSYENATLPAGTKITLHVGESAFNQYFIGDGFGWSSGQKEWWQDPRDVALTATGSTWAAQVDVNGYGRMSNDPGGGFNREAFPPEIQFVLRLELPDGTVLWDDRLHRDYWATARCPNFGSAPLASWGPF